MTNKLTVDEISLSGIGKKFNGRWIFKNIDFRILKGERISITGNNGSGKSTLLQIISGYVTPSEGKLSWNSSKGIIPVEKYYHNFSIATPYLELIEDFTLRENFDFFSKVKSFRNAIATDEIIKISMLEESAHLQLRYFSSGMKQRVKIVLALAADTNVILLDEPLSNLDATGYKWYYEMMERFLDNRILIVCSNNVAEETKWCTRNINIDLFKKT